MDFCNRISKAFLVENSGKYACIILFKSNNNNNNTQFLYSPLSTDVSKRIILFNDRYAKAFSLLSSNVFTGHETAESY